MITRKEFYVSNFEIHENFGNKKVCQIVTYYLFGLIPIYRNIIEPLEWLEMEKRLRD